MNPTNAKPIHPIFKNTQTKQPSATPTQKPTPQAPKPNACCKQQVKVAFRKALEKWHSTSYTGKDYKVCKSVVSEMFGGDEDF